MPNQPSQKKKISSFQLRKETFKLLDETVKALKKHDKTMNRNQLVQQLLDASLSNLLKRL